MVMSRAFCYQAEGHACNSAVALSEVSTGHREAPLTDGVMAAWFGG